MEGLADQSLNDLLEQVAAETPAPGGGCSAAWACALAAALTEMAAAFTLEHPEYADVHERMAEVHTRADELRREALALAERERHAYAPVLTALRLPAADPERSGRVAGALSDAAETPLATAAIAAEVAALAAEAARAGNPHLEGDAFAGAALAEAACRAAARLVELNLAERPSDERLSRARELVRLAASAREDAVR